MIGFEPKQLEDGRISPASVSRHCTVIFGRNTKQYRGKLQTEIEDTRLLSPVVRRHYRNGFIKHNTCATI